MPEEFEEQQETLETQANDTPPVEAEEEPKVVPVHVVKELREELRALKENERLTRNQFSSLMTEYQKLASGETNKAREMTAELDPEIQEALQPYLQPVREQLQTALTELNQVKQSRAQMENERYLEKNIPNLNEIRGDLIAYLQTLPEDVQDAYARNPKTLVPLANALFPSKKGAQEARGAMRSMAKTESGVTPTRSATSRPADLEGPALEKYLREHGWNV